MCEEPYLKGRDTNCPEVRLFFIDLPWVYLKDSNLGLFRQCSFLDCNDFEWIKVVSSWGNVRLFSSHRIYYDTLIKRYCPFLITFCHLSITLYYILLFLLWRCYANYKQSLLGKASQLKLTHKSSCVMWPRES